MLADALRHARRLNRNVRLYLLSSALQAVSAGALGIIYTLYLKALGYGTDFIGLALVVGTIGGGLGIVPANWLVRRWGWRTTLIWSDVIGAVSLALQVFIPTVPVILATTLGIGASVALVLVVNAPFLAANSDEAERTPVFALSTALGFLAAVLGSLLGGLLPGVFASAAARHSGVITALAPLLARGHLAQSYELAILATGAIALPSILPIFWLTETRPAAAAASSVAPAARVASGAWLGAWLRRYDWRAILAQLRVIANGPIGRFAATQSILGFGAGLFGPYVALYFVNALGASVAFFGALSSALTILLAVGSLVIVPLAARLGKIRAAVVTQALSLPFLLTLGLAPTLAVAAVALLIRGPLMNTSGPALQAYLMDRTAPEQRVLASGVYNVSWQLAGALGAGAGGLVIARVGYHAVFVAAAALYAVSITLVALWFGRPARPAEADVSQRGVEVPAHGAVEGSRP
ncbi:MAG TPA: MFS transporter [Ktedonobacterales bacterium]|jgi:MFS family permease